MPKTDGMKLRNYLKPEDLKPIEQILRDAGVFNAQEIDCCLELARQTLNGEDIYYWILAEEDGQLLGLICYGPVSLTDCTYDLYWILRSPEGKSRGVASALLKASEEDLRQRKARLYCLNTSGTAPYKPAHEFYQRSGFKLTARIPEYYRPGDDLLIFTKRIE